MERQQKCTLSSNRLVPNQKSKMTEAEFKLRTREFGLRVIRLVSSLPKGMVEDVLARQLLRSATSVGANYRSACRARSGAEMVSRLAIVEEEADESVYWLEMLVDAGLMKRNRVEDLIKEGNAIVAMTVASRRTLGGSSSKPQSKIQNPKSKISQ